MAATRMQIAGIDRRNHARDTLMLPSFSGPRMREVKLATVPRATNTTDDHLIVVTAQFNRLAKSWIGRADISCDHNGKRESRQLVGPKYVHSTECAAEYFMVYAARNWIEARLVARIEMPVSAS